MIRKLAVLVCALLISGCASSSVLSENEYWQQRSLQISQIHHLSGILTVPKKKKCDAVVVFLAGSGPADADYTIDGVGLFQELAQGLAKSGISSFRMDKKKESQSQITTIQEEILDDAQKVLSFMYQKYSRVIVLGHSLSGIVLPALEQSADALIILSASVSEVEEIYAAQLMKRADENEKKQIQEELKMIQNLNVDSGFSWFGIKESWWLSLDELHLKECLKSLKKPVLVMHGSEDEMIDASQLNQYRMVLTNHPDAKFVLLEGLDHYLRPSGSLHLDESVILQIASWILKSS